jgi:hypothetical protein
LVCNFAYVPIFACLKFSNLLFCGFWVLWSRKCGVVPFEIAVWIVLSRFKNICCDDRYLLKLVLTSSTYSSYFKFLRGVYFFIWPYFMTFFDSKENYTTLCMGFESFFYTNSMGSYWSKFEIEFYCVAKNI